MSTPAAPWAAVGTTTTRAAVHGVHGAAGRTYWKAFAGRRQLRSESEAVEWASLPPGGVSGEHRHTRTEEIYLVLSGAGELRLDGEAHPVRPGSLALTPVGAVHGLRNTGDGPLDWWVVETLAPATSEALTSGIATPLPKPGVPMPQAVVHDLFEEKAVDTDGVFSGPLKRIELVEIAAGERRTLGSPDAELAVYVHAGRGRAVAEALTETVELAPDTCLLVEAGTEIAVSATVPLRLAVVTLAVAAEGGRQ